jgi:hypothetical protein
VRAIANARMGISCFVQIGSAPVGRKEWIASASRCPLLFKGDDFAGTDVKPA